MLLLSIHSLVTLLEFIHVTNGMLCCGQASAPAAQWKTPVNICLLSQEVLWNACGCFRFSMHEHCLILTNFCYDSFLLELCASIYMYISKTAVCSPQSSICVLWTSWWGISCSGCLLPTLPSTKSHCKIFQWIFSRNKMPATLFL